MRMALVAALPLQDQTDFEVEQLLEANWWLNTFAPTAIRITLIIVGSLIIRSLVIRSVNRLVNKAVEHQERGQFESSRAEIQAARKAQRAQTLGALFKNIITIVVLGLMGLLVLGELGVNLAPLIAAAGVVGLAIGFGAQALVQDMVSGIFILMEDQYGVGDVVDVGDATGTVEEVQLRITKLRSLDGTLWFVRNGEILRVGNMSQDYSKVVLDVGIGYGSNIDEAKDILHQVAREFADHPDTQDVLETPEVLGVQALGADSVQLRVMLTTKPGEQWAASRALQERIKKAFDEAGIEIPFPQRTVWLKHLPEEAPEEVTGAPEPAPEPNG
jgi:small-conductance mechanosensitive channel